MQWTSQCPKQYINNCQLYTRPTLALNNTNDDAKWGQKGTYPIISFYTHCKKDVVEKQYF